jgi:hypothetical protein
VTLRSRHGNALVGEGLQINAHLLKRDAPFLTGTEDLFDQVHQAVAVLQHHLVKLTPLHLVDRRPAGFQRFKMQPDRRNRRLQFVGHGVDERIVLLVEPDLANQEGRIKDETGDDGRENETPDEEGNNFSKGKHHPSDIERDCQCHEADAEGDEKGNDALASRGDGHLVTIDLEIWRSIDL